jgi:hypothetical protein
MINHHPYLLGTGHSGRKILINIMKQIKSQGRYLPTAKGFAQ